MLSDLPFVDIGDGSKLKVLQVKEEEGLWIVENIFQKGYEVQTHRHTGPVYGYTVSGAWKYKEYDYVNRAGLVPLRAGGLGAHAPVHRGRNPGLVPDVRGQPQSGRQRATSTSVFDGAGTLAAYLALCEASGPSPAQRPG